VAIGSASDNANGKGASLDRSFSVALRARDRVPGSCSAGATSNPVDVRLELLDDDGDLVLDAIEPGIVCTPGAPTFVKFAVEFELPENCKGSELPRRTSRGDIHVKATTVDGSLEATRTLLCKRAPRSGD
jgi:hypothetical protein